MLSGNGYRDGLSSERLTSRFLNLSDTPQWLPFIQNSEAIRFFPMLGKENPEVETLAWIERQLKRYEDSRFGLQAILLKDSGMFIGQCGLLAQDVDGQQELEVAYHLLPAFWGNGYATEAARMFMDYGFVNFPVPRIISIIHKDNLRSQKLAERNGLSREQRTSWNEIDVDIHSITRKNWERNTQL